MCQLMPDAEVGNLGIKSGGKRCNWGVRGREKYKLKKLRSEKGLPQHKPDRTTR